MALFLKNVHAAMKSHGGNVPGACKLTDDLLQRVPILGKDQELARKALQNLTHGAQLTTFANGLRQGQERRPGAGRAASAYLGVEDEFLGWVRATACGLLHSSRWQRQQHQAQVFAIAFLLEF